MPFTLSPRSERRLGLRVQGWLRVSFWAVLLFGVHDPWNALGGIASERVRWGESFAIVVLFQIGCVTGAFAEDARDRSEPRRLWLSHILPLAIALLALVVFEARGETYRGLAVLSGTLAYCAGFDARFAAWPRMHGRPPLE